MKPSTIPMICGTALAAMTAAGFSHWWSTTYFISAIHASLPAPSPPERPPSHIPAAEPAAPKLIAQAPPESLPTPAADAAREKFYQSLIAKMDSLQNQNRDLMDQVAETNRDVMKLEFRVDTHSESFRPMPVNEERPDTSFDDGPGVLPPRADPVFLPTGE